MFENAHRWGLLTGGFAAGCACVLGLVGTTASAEPIGPLVPQPAPATVTQTVTVAAGAPTAPLAAAAPTAPVAAAAPGVTASPVGLPGQAAVVATPVAAPVATIAPATSQTLVEYFKDKGVQLEPQKSADFKALNIVLPMPSGWSPVPDPNVPDAFAVLADRVGGDGLYTSNAALVVYKLTGQFDPKEAISHGLIDSQQLPAWRATDASLAEYGGMPSSLSEGTYRENNMTLNTSRRHVIATSGPDTYLVSLSVTTGAQVSVAAGDATDAIVNGFKVGTPGPALPPPPPTPGPAAIPGVPQALGLPS